jgi:hypothetical protein
VSPKIVNFLFWLLFWCEWLCSQKNLALRKSHVRSVLTIYVFCHRRLQWSQEGVKSTKRPSITWLTAPQGLPDAHTIVKYTLKKKERPHVNSEDRRRRATVHKTVHHYGHGYTRLLPPAPRHQRSRCQGTTRCKRYDLGKGPARRGIEF